MITTNPDDVKNTLKGDEYDTATKGHRRNSLERAIGEGIYLIYKLEFPPDDGTTPNEPQESLNIEREASFLLQLKNLDQHGGSFGRFWGLEKKRKTTSPAHLQGEFGHLRYRSADPPNFLNYEGCEFLLISVSDDVKEELGLELRTDDSCSDLLKMLGETALTDPLVKGIWI